MNNSFNVNLFWPYKRSDKSNVNKITMKEFKLENNKFHDVEVKNIQKIDKLVHRFNGIGNDHGYYIALPKNISSKIKNITSWKIDITLDLKLTDGGKKGLYKLKTINNSQKVGLFGTKKWNNETSSFDESNIYLKFNDEVKDNMIILNKTSEISFGKNNFSKINKNIIDVNNSSNYITLTQQCLNLKTPDNISMSQTDEISKQYDGLFPDSHHPIIEQFIVKNIKEKNKCNPVSKATKIFNSGINNTYKNGNDGLWSGNIIDSEELLSQFCTSKNNISLGSFIGDKNIFLNVDGTQNVDIENKIILTFFTDKNLLQNYDVVDISITLNSPIDALENILNTPWDNETKDHKDDVYKMVRSIHGYKDIKIVEKNDKKYSSSVLLWNENQIINNDYNYENPNYISYNGIRDTVKKLYSKLQKERKIFDNRNNLMKSRTLDNLIELNKLKEKIIEINDVAFFKEYLIREKHNKCKQNLLNTNKKFYESNISIFDINKTILNENGFQDIEIMPHYNLYINKGKVGEEKIVLPIRNKNGMEIKPDFYKIFNKQILPFLGYKSSYDNNDHLYLILPEKISKYDNFNDKHIGTYIPKITRYTVNMNVILTGHNKKNNSKILFQDRYKKKDQQNYQTILLSNKDPILFLYRKKNENIEELKNALSLPFMKKYNVNKISNAHLIDIPNKNFNKNIRGSITPKNIEDNIDFESEINEYTFDVIHRIRENSTDKIDSYMVLKIKNFDSDNNINPIKTYWGENIYKFEDSKQNTIGTLTKNIGNAKIINIEDMVDINKNIYTSLPVFKHEDRKDKNTLLNADRLGSNTLNINNKHHIAIKLFGDDTEHFFRNLPISYLYNNINMNIDIPEYNLIKGIEKYYNETEMFDSSFKKIGNMEINKLNQLLKESNDYNYHINDTLIQDLKKKIEIATIYVDLKNKFSDAQYDTFSKYEDLLKAYEKAKNVKIPSMKLKKEVHYLLKILKIEHELFKVVNNKKNIDEYKSFNDLKELIVKSHQLYLHKPKNIYNYIQIWKNLHAEKTSHHLTKVIALKEKIKNNLELKFIENVKNVGDITELNKFITEIINAGHTKDNVIIQKTLKKIHNGLHKYKNELIDLSDTVGKDSDIKNIILKVSHGVKNGYHIFGDDIIKNTLETQIDKINTIRQNYINDLLIKSEKYIKNRDFKSMKDLLKIVESKNIHMDINGENIIANASIKVVKENIQLIIKELLNEINLELNNENSYNNKKFKKLYSNISFQSNNFRESIDQNNIIIKKLLETMHKNKLYWDKKILEIIKESDNNHYNNINILKETLLQIENFDVDGLINLNLLKEYLNKKIAEWEEKIENIVIDIEIDNKNYGNYKKLKTILLESKKAGHIPQSNIDLWVNLLDTFNNELQNSVENMKHTNYDINILKKYIQLSELVGNNNPCNICESELKWKKTYDEIVEITDNLLNEDDMIPLLVKETILAEKGNMKEGYIGDLENIITKLKSMGVDDSLLKNKELEHGEKILKDNLNLIENRLNDTIIKSEKNDNNTYILSRELNHANKILKLSKTNTTYVRGIRLKEKLLSDIKNTLNSIIKNSLTNIKLNGGGMDILYNLDSIIEKSLLQGILHDNEKIIIAKKISNHLKKAKSLWISDTLNTIKDASFEMKHFKNKLDKEKILYRLRNNINLLKLKKVNNENSYPEFPNILKTSENVFSKLKTRSAKSTSREKNGLYYFLNSDAHGHSKTTKYGSFVKDSDTNIIKYHNINDEYVDVSIKCKKGFINIQRRFVYTNVKANKLSKTFFISLDDKIFIPIVNDVVHFKKNPSLKKRETYLIVENGTLKISCIPRLYNSTKIKTYKQNYPGFFKKPYSVMNNKYKRIMSHRLIDAVSGNSNKIKRQSIKEANVGSMGRLARLKAKNL
jgi:hypothetical protein